MFCDIYGNKCFDDSFTNLETTCDCPLECNSITYSFSVVSSPLDPKELCPPEGDGWESSKSFLMEPFYKNPPKFLRKLMKIKSNVSEDAMDYCKRSIKYRAVVIFRLATDSMSVTVMSQRLTFFDKMSAFGKS